PGRAAPRPWLPGSGIAAHERSRFMIRVLLADDQALVRAGFNVLLSSASDIEIVAEAANGEEAVSRAREKRPDVVLMDIRMPGVDDALTDRWDRRAPRTAKGGDGPRQRPDRAGTGGNGAGRRRAQQRRDCRRTLR